MVTLTCIPGLMGTTDVFADLASRVPGTTVMDLPQSADFRDIADRLARDVPEDTVLCGLSMGAYLALAIARRVPEKLRGLILISGSATADSADAAAMREKTVAWANRKGVDALAAAQAQALLAPANREKADLKERLLDMARAVGLDTFALHQAALAGRPDQRDDLAEITCPTLILTGEEDTVTPPDAARAMADRLGAAQLHLVPQAGHLPPIEAPDAVAGLVTAFLDDPKAGARPTTDRVAT
ncbi:MAG: alpha/beta fold hydrolase [Pseudooceanicola nanhaiensis]|uniref:alpha/beta fold hydrolase n=1 Tax=Rhodobacterales TaxID=204455 RepID=UPI004059FEBE